MNDACLSCVTYVVAPHGDPHGPRIAALAIAHAVHGRDSEIGIAAIRIAVEIQRWYVKRLAEEKPLRRDVRSCGRRPREEERAEQSRHRSCSQRPCHGSSFVSRRSSGSLVSSPQLWGAGPPSSNRAVSIPTQVFAKKMTAEREKTGRPRLGDARAGALVRYLPPCWFDD
jgi:hypothetical protein